MHSVKFNAVLNAVKQLVSTIFPIITVPYITRVLGADSYGQVNYANSIVSYFVLLAGMGISTYATREGARIRNDKQRLSKFVNQMFTVNVFACLLSYAALLVLMLVWRPGSNLAILIFILSFSIAANTFGVDWVNVIFEDYVYITLRYIIFQVLAFASMLIFVHGSHDADVYAGCMVLPLVGGSLCNLWYIRRYVHPRLTKDVQFGAHVKAIVTLFANNVASTIYLSSDQTLLGIFSGSRAVGLYSLPVKAYSMIRNVLNALTYVMVPRLSAMIATHEEKQIIQLLNRTFCSLLTLILPASVGLFFLSPEIVSVLSGPQYAESSSVLQILSIALLFSVYSCFFANGILIPYRKESQFLLATSVAAVINLVLNCICIPLWGINGAAVTTLVAEMYILIHVYRAAAEYYRPDVSMRMIVSVVLGSVFVGLICVVGKMWVPSIALRLIVVIAVSVPSYLIIELLIGNIYVKNITLSLLRKIANR